ncbi:uncharacterized protein LOC129612202 [Condylostylus longicornis]|uniref:uncharacterized protein LOC129612202 n=1 Tax=Condylostylus longicornis TaxID=2530218 RepID=UPI00244DE55F|nr:uncharacterized protein LOC129612202 [Condylostylus longicornis]
MDEINVEYFISLVEVHECIWNNSVINAESLPKIESAWSSIAFIIYENFDALKGKQKFWVNNLKRKWKSILSKFKTLGKDYEHFHLLQFLAKSNKFNSLTFEGETKFANSEPLKCGEILFTENVYIYKCLICNISFASLYSFETHISTVHSLPLLEERKNENLAEVSNGENIEYLIEDFCEENIKKEFNIQERFKKPNTKEEVTEISTSEQMIVMNEAKVDYFDEFKNQENNSHKRLKHTNQIECPHCSIIFELNEHDINRCFEIQDMILKLNGDLRALRDEGIYHCDRCSKYFDSSIKMHNHRRREHYEICPVCKIRLLNIENHVISHHTDIDYKKLKIPDSFNSGMFECKFCDKVFEAKDIWLRHKNKCSITKQENHKFISLS